ncbi:hypothetical protein BDV26DRAFT_67145 [Aspergillus bertholletiae]|uniref:3-oxo-5-alpha-steroid 4-dehydrogenase C-terminal domain-containing protein n=1 Tax=Aspergillus bertholletiae TaxID=1226010 RepID=A0A5N7AVW7_9EURO|nr:hypothetical protein BDV26DRAFT_67145 [Aspergillus bertholletiae]
MGKTSLKNSILNIPGRLAWTTMELMAPLNFMYVLMTLSPTTTYMDTETSSLTPSTTTTAITVVMSLPPQNQILAVLYLLHYVNRAVISPLFAAPSMSPIHAFIAISGLVFNWFNSTCLAAWLVGYHVPVVGYNNTTTITTTTTSGSGKRPVISDYLPYVGIVLFFLGMTGNIVAERTFFRLRREEADRLHATTSKDHSAKKNSNDNKYSKVYVIPPAKGLFRYILYPHYVCEWLEWTGFILVGTAVYPAPGVVAPPMNLAPWLAPAAAVADRLQVPLPLPAVIFAVNAVTSMIPQARLGKKWYLGRFGKDKVAGRGAVVPLSNWL